MIIFKISGFHAGSLSWSNCKFGDVGFCGGRKTGEPAEKPSEQGENQPQTQPTYNTGPESNPGPIRERRVLSPMRHPCSPNIYY